MVCHQYSGYGLGPILLIWYTYTDILCILYSQPHLCFPPQGFQGKTGPPGPGGVVGPQVGTDAPCRFRLVTRSTCSETHECLFWEGRWSHILQHADSRKHLVLFFFLTGPDWRCRTQRRARTPWLPWTTWWAGSTWSCRKRGWKGKEVDKLSHRPCVVMRAGLFKPKCCLIFWRVTARPPHEAHT